MWESGITVKGSGEYGTGWKTIRYKKVKTIFDINDDWTFREIERDCCQHGKTYGSVNGRGRGTCEKCTGGKQNASQYTKKVLMTQVG